MAPKITLAHNELYLSLLGYGTTFGSSEGHFPEGPGLWIDYSFIEFRDVNLSFSLKSPSLLLLEIASFIKLTIMFL